MLEACTAKQYNHFVRNTSYWGVKCTRICIGLALQVCTYMSLLHPNIGVVLEIRACTGAIQSANYIFWNMSGSFPTSPSRNWFIDSSIHRHADPCYSRCNCSGISSTSISASSAAEPWRATLKPVPAWRLHCCIGHKLSLTLFFFPSLSVFRLYLSSNIPGDVSLKICNASRHQHCLQLPKSLQPLNPEWILDRCSDDLCTSTYHGNGLKSWADNHLFLHRSPKSKPGTAIEWLSAGQLSWHPHQWRTGRSFCWQHSNEPGIWFSMTSTGADRLKVHYYPERWERADHCQDLPSIDVDTRPDFCVCQPIKQNKWHTK